MNTRHPDFTPLIDLLAQPGSGAVRERRPRYVDLLPPCNHACPAGENIQSWLSEASVGRYHEAWLALMRDNPLPSIHGRVCYHPCENDCNRARLDEAVSIHSVERFIGDHAGDERWSVCRDAPPSGRRVLIVGSGPAGLSAAYQLARLGHDVEIHDAAPLAGGMLRFGIPAYRLPRATLNREIERIESLGVRFVLDHPVSDVLAEQTTGGFDAVFLAIGAGTSRHVEVPARDAARVLDAVSLLHRVGSGEAPVLGRRIVVYGGGNTALDAARTARRLGAEDALIIYRRDRAHMPAHAFEVNEALEEGVKIRWLSTIQAVVGPDICVETMELDSNGRPHPTGHLEHLSADAVVLALGQDTDSSFLQHVAGIELSADGSVRVGASMMTAHPGIFAGGDMIGEARSVAHAVGHGKHAGRYIDAYLKGANSGSATKHPLVEFTALHLPLYTDAERREPEQLSATVRTSGFTEVVAGLTDAQARYEAQRCFSCGNCFECDQCYAACPEQAIEKLGPGLRYRFDYARCTGCGVCFETCPCHAIDMVVESPDS